MFRFTSWFFTSLGIALLIVSALVTPQNAFADPGSYCFEECWESEDPACSQICCEGKCGDPEGEGFSECFNTCTTAAAEACWRTGSCGGSATYNPCAVNDNAEGGCRSLCCAYNPDPNKYAPCFCQWTATVPPAFPGQGKCKCP
jgi:hypothetical protein